MCVYATDQHAAGTPQRRFRERRPFFSSCKQTEQEGTDPDVSEEARTNTDPEPVTKQEEGALL